MKDLIDIKYWIFDLDNTLYSGQTQVFSEVDKKMSSFISEKFNVDLIKKQRDVWTFARIMGSDDPNWKLVATGE